MTWFADLSACTYFPRGGDPSLRAVGWLERGRPYPTGPVDDAVFRRLVTMAVRPWQSTAFLGHHTCDLCDDALDGMTLEAHGERVDLGASNLFVPSPHGVLVAPSLVLHYIRDHDYAPPDEFLEAVMACPPMGSKAYLRALEDAGGHALIKGIGPD